MSRIYVGRLSYQVREKDVERFFRGFGRIRDINLKNGFGFVEFDDPRDADDAVYECNGRELLGERIIVEHARGSGGGGYRGGGGGRGGGGWGRGGGGRFENKGYGPPTRTDHRLRVENISSRVSWQDLKDFMRQAGDITYADAHKQRVGEGTVEYASREDMKNALRKLDGAELNGRKLKLTEDRGGGGGGGGYSRYNKDRSHSRSRSRSRDRSRSRSYSRSRSRSRDKDRSRSRSKSPKADKTRKSRSRSRSRDRSRENSEPRRSRSKSPAGGGDGEQGERPNSRSEPQSQSPQNSRPRSTSPDRERSPPAQEMRSRSPSPAKGSGHED